MKRGFSLLELLAAIAVLAVLAVIALPLVQSWKQQARMAQSSSNLRQLAIATQLFLVENNDEFFPFRREGEDGIVWFFGKERFDGPKGEGNRILDLTYSPLYPYIEDSGVQICPGFDYNSPHWKPKFAGPSWAYGYNISLGGLYSYVDGSQLKPAKRFSDLQSPSQIILFGTCAQVNTFQAPASPADPMIEEFYFIDDTFRTIHFRFGGKALMVFTDGHIREMEPHPGTLDTRLPSANVGRITPRGSRKYLE